MMLPSLRALWDHLISYHYVGWHRPVPGCSQPLYRPKGKGPAVCFISRLLGGPPILSNSLRQNNLRSNNRLADF